MECVSWITVYPSSITLQTGHWYYDAWAEVCPVDAEIVWYSDNTSVASVNETSGYIYANSPGTARIYAEATDGSGISDYLTVTVSGEIAVQTVTLNRTSLSIEKGSSATISATVYPTNATNKTINWRSANTNIATVNNGRITAKAKGGTYIYAEATDGSGVYGRCYVSVTEAVLVASVNINPYNLTMTAGESAYLYATVCPPDANNQCVVWETSDWCVAEVNPDSGFVYAMNEGEATITATACDGSGVYGECVITVEPPIPVEGIGVSPTSLTMNVGDTRKLNTTICPANATNKMVTWRSSDENVATVELRTGLVTAKRAGSATITATTADGGFAARCSVTVDQVSTGSDSYIDNEEVEPLVMDKPYDSAYPYENNFTNSQIYYNYLNNYSYELRNDVVYEFTFEEFNRFRAHLSLLHYQRSTEKQAKQVLENIIDIVSDLAGYIPKVGIVFGLLNTTSTISSLGDGDVQDGIRDIKDCVDAFSYYMADNNRVYKKSNSVTYRVSLLMQDPIYGREIKIESSDGDKDIYTLHNASYASAQLAASIYAHNITIYKVAPGYTYYYENLT